MRAGEPRCRAGSAWPAELRFPSFPSFAAPEEGLVGAAVPRLWRVWGGSSESPTSSRVLRASGMSSLPGFLGHSRQRRNPGAAFHFSWVFTNSAARVVFLSVLYFQIEKIMSSIGEGIDFSQEQQRISGSVPSSCVPVSLCSAPGGGAGSCVQSCSGLLRILLSPDAAPL